MGTYEGVGAWRMRTKLKLIECKGGKCIRCGYDKTTYLRAFAFHHRDASQKDFGIGHVWGKYSWERLVQEADKCDLVCVRCHAEIHDEADFDQRQEWIDSTD